MCLCNVSWLVFLFFVVECLVWYLQLCSGQRKGVGSLLTVERVYSHHFLVLLHNNKTGNDSEMWAAEIGGNERVNTIFEANLHFSDAKPNPNSDSKHRAAFLHEKYVHHRYLDVQKYSLCRVKRTAMEDDDTCSKSSLSQDDSIIASAHIGALKFNNSGFSMTRSSSFNNRMRCKNDNQIDSEGDDVFANSATIPSDLFGRSNKKKPADLFERRKSTAGFDGPVIEEESSDEEEEYSKFPATSLSDLTAFNANHGTNRLSKFCFYTCRTIEWGCG